MREILFRGRHIVGKGWCAGDLINTKGAIPPYMPMIMQTVRKTGEAMAVDVDPDTIGQYTGLKDKNGRRIFEGDIVRDMDGATYPVVWGGTGFYLRYDPPHAHGMEYELLPLCNYWHAHGPIIEIIGNIHDNPELMDGGDEDGKDTAAVR